MHIDGQQIIALGIVAVAAVAIGRRLCPRPLLPRPLSCPLSCPQARSAFALLVDRPFKAGAKAPPPAPPGTKICRQVFSL